MESREHLKEEGGGRTRATVSQHVDDLVSTQGDDKLMQSTKTISQGEHEIAARPILRDIQH